MIAPVQQSNSGQSRPSVNDPLPAEVREVLRPLERLHFEVALRMNREPVKALWTFLEKYVGALVVRLATRNLVRVHGFERVVEASERGTVLFVANHRTYYDLFIVSSLIHRRIPGRKRLYFPVTGQYYYQSLGGILLNQVFAFWSMFPPLFALPGRGPSDRYALGLLSELCSRGPRHFLGIHPEGARNTNPDTWSYLRFQPGAGRIIHAARPIVLPVFIGGLVNNPVQQLARNWRGGEKVRVWFGDTVDLDPLLALPPKASTYKLITDAVMNRVIQLGELDRASLREADSAVRPSRERQ
ncbi:MAG: lysophospholipid acyltransferase family protein [Gemmatimonadota bacterium]